jgi:hypothetical protein
MVDTSLLKWPATATLEVASDRAERCVGGELPSWRRRPVNYLMLSVPLSARVSRPSAAAIKTSVAPFPVMSTVRAAVPFWRVHVLGAKGGAEGRGESNLRIGCIGAPATDDTFEPVDSVRSLVESFAAVEGRAPLPISPRQLIDVTAAFEAVIKSLDRGAPVNVAK